MYVIVGLGNPGTKYEMTRHNMGFLVLDKFASLHNFTFDEKKHNALISRGSIYGEKIALIKPQTFMNLSGNAVASFMNFYKKDRSNLIVVYDDVDLITGLIRIRERGSAGTHNGMKDIINKLGTSDFKRIRTGIGLKPPFLDLADYVLQNFAKDDLEQVKEGIDKSVAALDEILKNGVVSAMNNFNKKEKQ